MIERRFEGDLEKMQPEKALQVINDYCGDYDFSKKGIELKRGEVRERLEDLGIAYDKLPLMQAYAKTITGRYELDELGIEWPKKTGGNGEPCDMGKKEKRQWLENQVRDDWGKYMRNYGHKMPHSERVDINCYTLHVLDGLGCLASVRDLNRVRGEED